MERFRFQQCVAAFPRIRINPVDPGFTATDFHEYRGTRTSSRVRRDVRYALSDKLIVVFLRQERRRSLVNRQRSSPQAKLGALGQAAV
jgi:hypothetical protein